MSGKLDQSLDEILSTRRAAGRGRARGRRATTAKAAPVGGISKNTTKVAGKAAVKAATTAPAAGMDQKIIVSNLVRITLPSSETAN